MKAGNILLVVLAGLAGLLGLGVVGGVVVIALLYVSPSPSYTSATSATAKANPSPTAAPVTRRVKIGQAVSDGKLEFVVQNVDCGRVTVGDGFFLTKTAQGQFCLVSVSVKNISNETRTLDRTDQTAVSDSGVKYADDTEAELYVNQDTQTVLNGINPGNQVAAVLVFDIAKGAKINRLDFHDSASNDGVIVDVN
jgi:hypothetical protein